MTRTFIAEVLDIYKKGGNNRYGSVESAVSVDSLAWFSVRVYLPLIMVRVSNLGILFKVLYYQVAGKQRS
jgi:hypothetical protein